MKLADFAPHLAGAMLPGLFTYHVDRRERFPGDPWPHMKNPSEWYWMHATGCPGGLYRSIRNREYWQRAEQAEPTATPRPVPRRVPAAAPLQRDLFAEVAP